MVKVTKKTARQEHILIPARKKKVAYPISRILFIYIKNSAEVLNTKLSMCKELSFVFKVIGYKNPTLIK